jgi:excisionase family DNA binding protein
MTSDRLWLSPKQAANLLGVGLTTLRGYIKRGALPARRIRGSRLLRVHAEDLQRLLEPRLPREPREH